MTEARFPFGDDYDPTAAYIAGAEDQRRRQLDRATIALGLFYIQSPDGSTVPDHVRDMLVSNLLSETGHG